MQFLLFLAIGAVAGLIGGLLGVGGGIIIVPALTLLGKMDIHRAVGTSSAVIVLTAISAAYKHHQNGNVLWPVVVAVGIGSILFAFLGASWAAQVPQHLLKRIFALFLMLVAVQIFLSSLSPSHPSATVEEKGR